jgi:hypothetical protein
MSSWIARRSGGNQRHAFNLDRVVGTPHHNRFRGWHAPTSFLTPRRAELEAALSRPEASSDSAA